MYLKQKFFLLAGLVGAMMAIVSIFGFFTAYSNLEESVEGEMKALVADEANKMDAWLESKSASPRHVATLQAVLGANVSLTEAPQYMGIVESDKDILDIYVGRDSDGKIVCYYAGDISAKLDPRTRGWYKDAKAADKLIYSEVYVDANSGKNCISIAAPYKVNGAFAGVIGADVSADVLNQQVKSILYRGEGVGYIIDNKGMLLATDGDDKVMENISTVAGIGEKFDAMQQKGEGYFIFDGKDGKMVFAYNKIPSTDWIVGIAVPESFVFSSLSSLKVTYGILTLLGIVISVFMCLKLSATITGPVVELKQRADEMANGNLRQQAMEVKSRDEIGEMTESFNTMAGNLRNLISKMASTSQQVAAASEELTANAQQSADSAVHVAETVADVRNGMESQLDGIDTTKREVDAVFIDINNMNEKTRVVQEASAQTSKAAKHGEELMQNAIDSISGIEKGVMASAAMVKELADQSQEIGTIVEAISAIADQTNLLALNAAIEAARAGEQGRGFAVVAEEVRKLAAESSESAEQIREKLGAIQTATKRAVEAMENGNSEVEAGTAAINAVGSEFRDILSKVENIQVQMKQITDSAATVSTGASNIVSAVDKIDSISRSTATSTETISRETEQQSASNEEIAAASQSLANLAGEMQSAISKFKV